MEGGSCNDYDYVCGDPVNGFDLDGTIADSCALTHSPSWCANMRANYVPPLLVDRAARQAVKAAGGHLRRCGTSGSGRQVFCVENVRRMPALGGPAGVTYGHYVFCRGICDDILSHELVHVDQWEKYGDAFGLMYAIEAAQHGTCRNNKYEAPAYAQGGNC